MHFKFLTAAYKNGVIKVITMLDNKMYMTLPMCMHYIEHIKVPVHRNVPPRLVL